ncbi:MAG TPA: zeta toxin family protein [Polyangiaceae bacterium]|nr:zeta toxin family protein [Polyangiaceae bacterium]
MVEMIREHAARGDSFAFETTLAGRTYAHWIRDWRSSGYRVALWFLGLATPEMAIGRVAERVRQGGHHIPDDVVRRRFAAGNRNFETIYSELVDEWALYDNSGRPIELTRNPSLPRALPALVRARRRAEAVAAATETAIIDVVDGKVVRWYPGRAEPEK